MDPNQKELFSEEAFIRVQPDQAYRVWYRLNQIDPGFGQNVFFAFHQNRKSDGYSHLIRLVQKGVDAHKKGSRLPVEVIRELESLAVKSRIKARAVIQSLDWKPLTKGLRFAVASNLRVPLPVLLHFLNTMSYGENYVLYLPDKRKAIARNFARGQHQVIMLDKAKGIPCSTETNTLTENVLEWLYQSRDFREYFSIRGDAQASASRIYDLAS